MNRRRFIQTAASGSPRHKQRSAPRPPGRLGDGIKLGFDTYSVRAFQWKDIQLLDFAAGLKVDTIQISDSADYSSLDPAPPSATSKLTPKASGFRSMPGSDASVRLSKSWKATGVTPEQVVVDGLRVAKAVGARSMRCFMGSMDDRRGDLPVEVFIASTIKVLKAVRSQAQDIGVKIALENHAGDMQAREVRTIIEESGRDVVASCLDTGNPMWVMEDPQVTLEILGPYAVTTHVRDSVVFEHPRGAAAQWVALGDGIIDWAAFFDLYRKVCPDALLQLEIITGRPPQILPYYEKDWWKWFPKNASGERSFARFEALAHQGPSFYGNDGDRGRARSKPGEYTEALKEQQRQDLERSIRFAQQELGLGIRWKTA